MLIAICVSLAAAFAHANTDEAKIRASLMAQSKAAMEGGIPSCIDVTLERETFPRMSNAELNERWQQAQDKPDHPDGTWLRQELAMRMAPLRWSLRFLYESPDSARIAWDVPAPGMKAFGERLVRMTDMEAAATVKLMKSDAGLLHGVVWQGNDLSLALMPEGAQSDSNPRHSIESAVELVRSLMYSGVEGHSPAAFSDARIVSGTDGVFEMTLGEYGYIGFAQPYRRIAGKYDDNLSRTVISDVYFYETAEAQSKNEHVARIQLSEWQQIDGTDEYLARRNTEFSKQRRYERSVDAMRPVSEVRLISVGIVDCEKVRKSAAVPEVVETNDGFQVFDPVRSGWKVRSVRDVVAGRLYSTDAPGLVSERDLTKRSLVRREVNPGVAIEVATSDSATRWPVWIVPACLVAGVVSAGFLYRRFKVS